LPQISHFAIGTPDSIGGAARWLYGESNAATTDSSEDFPHLGVRIAGKSEGKPREVGNELLVGLRIDLVGYDVEPAINLALEMLDPFLGEVSHFSRASELLTEIDGASGGFASDHHYGARQAGGLVSANLGVAAPSASAGN
jgi:hypothetical protein